MKVTLVAIGIGMLAGAAAFAQDAAGTPAKSAVHPRHLKTPRVRKHPASKMNHPGTHGPETQSREDFS